MRNVIAVVITVGALLPPAQSQAQSRGALGGFGGVSLAASANNVVTPNLGGTMTVTLIPNIQLVGEAGRLGNVLPPLADTLYGLTGAGVKASAYYGEGGVRLVASPRSHVSPYAEATIGIARLTVSTTGLGRIGNAVVPAVVALLPHTGKVAGGGAGLVMHVGALQMDLGYRFKQIFPPDVLGIALGLGQSMRSHQVRAGIGVRF